MFNRKRIENLEESIRKLEEAIDSIFLVFRNNGMTESVQVLYDEYEKQFDSTCPRLDELT